MCYDIFIKHYIDESCIYKINEVYFHLIPTWSSIQMWKYCYRIYALKLNEKILFRHLQYFNDN